MERTDLSLGFCRGCGKIAGRCNCDMRKTLGFAEREKWLTYKPVILLEKIRVPLYLAYGQYEQMTDQEVVEHNKDIQAEITRRQEAGHDLSRFESYSS